MNLATCLSSVELGVIYAIMALGVFLSFRTLNMPDLTVDGSFVLGAAAVSYTHLAQVAIERDVWVLTDEPVSYTHLDVYKRQIPWLKMAG